MKILIYTTFRTGSHSLGDFLSKELGIQYYDELNSINYNNEGDFITKEVPIQFFSGNEDRGKNYKFDIIQDYKFFDKIIILYRKNLIERCISDLFANEKNVWRHSGENFDAYYEISKEFIKNKREYIKEEITHHELVNNFLLTLPYGIKVSYEDLFYGEGINEISNYLCVKFKNEIKNENLKLNKTKFDIKSYYESLQ